MMKVIDYLIERVKVLEKEVKTLKEIINEKDREIEHSNYVNRIFRHEIDNEQLAMNANVCLLEESQDEKEKIDRLKSISISSRNLINLMKEWSIYQKAGYRFEWCPLIDILKGHNLHRDITINIVKSDISILSTPAGRIIASSLVNNTAMHGGDEVKNITVEWEKVPKGIIIVYKDDGVGVPEKMKESIFNKGVGKNTGLGLFLARQILKISGCSIIENGVEGKGARFEIFIPDGAYRLY